MHGVNGVFTLWYFYIADDGLLLTMIMPVPTPGMVLTGIVVWWYLLIVWYGTLLPFIPAIQFFY